MSNEDEMKNSTNIFSERESTWHEVQFQQENRFVSVNFPSVFCLQICLQMQKATYSCSVY